MRIKGACIFLSFLAGKIENFEQPMSVILGQPTVVLSRRFFLECHLALICRVVVLNEMR